MQGEDDEMTDVGGQSDKAGKPVCPEYGRHRPPNVTASERGFSVHKGFAGGKGWPNTNQRLSLYGRMVYLPCRSPLLELVSDATSPPVNFRTLLSPTKEPPTL